MKTLQITMQPELVREVDRAAKSEKVTRSAFVRGALERELRRRRLVELEKLDRDGYARQPIQPGEFEPMYRQSASLQSEEGQWIEVKSAGTRSRHPTKGGRSSSSRGKAPSRTLAKSPSRK